MAANEQVDYHHYGRVTQAKQVASQAYPTAKPAITSQAKKAKEKRPSLAWTPGEKCLLAIVAVVFIAGVIFTVYTTNQVNHLHRNWQDVQSQLTETSIANENLQQNAQELSQYERISQLAEKHGLSFNDENVRNIKP